MTLICAAWDPQPARTGPKPGSPGVHRDLNFRLNRVYGDLITRFARGRVAICLDRSFQAEVSHAAGHLSAVVVFSEVQWTNQARIGGGGGGGEVGIVGSCA